MLKIKKLRKEMASRVNFGVAKESKVDKKFAVPETLCIRY